MRSTVDLVGANPPPNQPKFPAFCRRTLEDLACPDVAAELVLSSALNEPLIFAVPVSLEKSMRSTVDTRVPGTPVVVLPPPNQP